MCGCSYSSECGYEKAYCQGVKIGIEKERQRIYNIINHFPKKPYNYNDEYHFLYTCLADILDMVKETSYGKYLLEEQEKRLKGEK